MNIDNFNWGTSNEWYIETIKSEIFENKLYDKFFTVEENDVVLDFYRDSTNISTRIWRPISS